ncbi:alpha/beta hydrolase [Ideonella alba]|uniref:Alpha/beta hydrolase n=1 Tax=Ideonella alba TaxID=2824118 RepID=A0A940YH18_9BURK|nr:alpha/beta hydrolase [Ideonella alba]MBQ0932375.1 alpha/beta hydrolase [Ideonella alba]
MNAFDPVWLDQQYNNRARIPDHAALFERWRQASALARQQLDGQHDLAYGDAPSQTLDLFRTERRDAPVLVFIHGGYWRSLDKSDHSFIAPSFVADGAHVVVPNYSLCPGVGIADIALEMTRVIAWIVARAGELGIDPTRLALVGHSAGAHLAAMLLCCRWKDVDPALPPQPLAGALGISGLYDLEPLRHAPFIRGDLQLSERDAWRLSPAFYPRPRKPLYAVAGGDESEEFIRQNRLIRDQWGPSSVPVCETLARHHHLDILHNLADPAGRLHDLALRLLGLR